MPFWTLLVSLFGVQGHKMPPQSTQREHQGAPSPSFKGQFLFCFATCPSQATGNTPRSPKVFKRSPHALKVPKGTHQTPKIYETVAKAHFYTQKTKLPVAKELQETKQITLASQTQETLRGAAVSRQRSQLCFYMHSYGNLPWNNPII